MKLRLRPARPSDRTWILAVSNDPEVRKASFAGARIGAETHKKWFHRKLKDPRHAFYVLSGDAGFARFQMKGKNAVISVHLSRQKRGAGLGRRVIRASCQKLFRTTPVLRVDAFIKSWNERSIRAFAAAGFERVGRLKIKGQEAIHYRLNKSGSAQKPRYIVLGNRPWVRAVFDKVICRYPGRWTYAGSPDRLQKAVRAADPLALFFVHWSWKVPSEIVNRYECVCFHMTDLPFGRGGTPLQNLILRGFRTTKLTAFRMSDEIDAGPVYFKENLSLEGSAEQIYVRATHLAARMIRRILRERPTPKPQKGRVTRFVRRVPADSRVPRLGSPRKLYDFIRMLDAEGYPRAFVEDEGFRCEFSRAKWDGKRVGAHVTLIPLEEKKP